MAALAQAPLITMAAQSENTRIILDAIGGMRKEVSDGLGAVNITVAALGRDVANVQRDVSELKSRMERLDDGKAEKGELQALESRVEKSVSEVKASAAFEAGRLSQEWTQRLDAIANEVKDLRDDVKSLNAVRYKIIGGCLVIGSVAGAFFGWLFHLIK